MNCKLCPFPCTNGLWSSCTTKNGAGKTPVWNEVRFNLLTLLDFQHRRKVHRRWHDDCNFWWRSRQRWQSWICNNKIISDLYQWRSRWVVLDLTYGKKLWIYSFERTLDTTWRNCSTLRRCNYNRLKSTTHSCVSPANFSCDTTPNLSYGRNGVCSNRSITNVVWS